MSILKTISVASLAFVASTSILAEDIAITGGTAFTMGSAGKIENATVLIKDGKIEKVGAGVEVPAGYTVIDATGKWVTPGLMGSQTGLGLHEGPSWAGVNDGDATKAKVGPALDATWGLNPNQTPFAVNRIEGITRAATNISRSMGLFSGQGAVISLDGADVLRRNAYITLSVGERAAEKVGGRPAVWQKVIADLKAAAPKKKGKKSRKSKGKDDAAKPNPDRDALAKLFTGEVTLVINASRMSDILNIIRLKEKFPKIKMAINGAHEGWMVAKELAASGIPVILHPTDNLPGNFERLAATQENAGRLEKAGVKIAIAGNGDANVRLAIQNAGNAVANGMSWQGAMAALTTGPAEIYGVSKNYGTLEKGMVADVVVWGGDPLEVMTSPDAVIIGGENMPLVSRQTKLRDRYQNTPRSPAYVK